MTLKYPVTLLSWSMASTAGAELEPVTCPRGKDFVLVMQHLAQGASFCCDSVEIFVQGQLHRI